MNNDEFKEVPQGTEDNDINMSENEIYGKSLLYHVYATE